MNNISRDESMTNHSQREIIARLIKYLKPYKWQSGVVVVLFILIMLIEVVNPYLLKIAIDDNIANGDINGLFVIGGILVGINLVGYVLSRFKFILLAKITNKTLLDIREELYQYIQTLSFDFFDSRPVGKILARVVGDVTSLKNLFDQTISTLIPSIMMLITVAIAMLVLNFKLGLCCIALLPILGIAMGYIEINADRRWKIYRNKRSAFNGFTHEDFSGIKVVQAFGNEKLTEEKFEGLVDELSDTFVDAVRIQDTFWPCVEMSWGVGTLVVFIVGYKLFTGGEIEIGTLVAFCGYIGMFWRPISNLTTFINSLTTNFSAADRIFDILDTKAQIVSDKGAESIGEITGEVEFEDVDFKYEENGRKILDNVSFTVKPGERVALVGPTGAGKTTIISLLSRFYDPVCGKVLVDGKDIKHVDLKSYRSQMGIMLQDTFLFSTSIKENIRYGRLDATDEEIIAAAKAVNAHEFIVRLENGYDTEVNERGSRLSLGQRQLISFARALLANPKILILDEATSNIDTQTEILVQHGIEKLMKDRTSFVIAHRLSTIRDCDKIMVINHGQIVEAGTHEELLKKQGEYHKLYTAQYSFIDA